MVHSHCIPYSTVFQYTCSHSIVVYHKTGEHSTNQPESDVKSAQYEDKSLKEKISLQETPSSEQFEDSEENALQEALPTNGINTSSTH